MSRLCAVASLGTNRAMYALPVKRMLDGRAFRAQERNKMSNREYNRISSLKRSNRRSFWQLKAYNHDHYDLISLQFYIDGIIDQKGFIHTDIKKIWEIEYGPNTIEEYDLKLKKTKQSNELTYFEVIDKVHEYYLESEIWLSNKILECYESKIDLLYLKIREGNSNEIVFNKIKYE